MKIFLNKSSQGPNNVAILPVKVNVIFRIRISVAVVARFGVRVRARARTRVMGAGGGKHWTTSVVTCIQQGCALLSKSGPHSYVTTLIFCVNSGMD